MSTIVSFSVVAAEARATMSDGVRGGVQDDDVDGSRVLAHRRWVRVGAADDDDDTEPSRSPFVRPSPARPATTRTTTRRFRAATYNVLADCTIPPDDYLYCPAQLRYMAGRHDRIVAEIRRMQPHVICLQVSRYTRTHTHTSHTDRGQTDSLPSLLNVTVKVLLLFFLTLGR